MSHGAVNEDAESSEPMNAAHGLLSRGVSVTVSGNYIGAARARPFAATSVPLCGARTYDSACAPGWRTVSTGDIQDSPRRACTIARLFSQQRFVPKRNCHPRSEEVLDLDAGNAADMAERSAGPPAICLEFAFDRQLPMKLQQVYGLLVADCARPMRQGVQGERRRCP